MGCIISRTVSWKGALIFIARGDGPGQRTAGLFPIPDPPLSGTMAPAIPIQKQYRSIAVSKALKDLTWAVITGMRNSIWSIAILLPPWPTVTFTWCQLITKYFGDAGYILPIVTVTAGTMPGLRITW